MTGNIKQTVAAALLSICVFVALVFIAFDSAYDSLSILVMSVGDADLYEYQGVLFIIFGAFSCFLFTGLRQLFIGCISKTYIVAFCVLYFIAFVLVVLFKSSGIREINLDVTDLFRQLIEFPVSVVLNVLFFVPIGIVLRLVLQRSWWSLPAALFIICGVEALQYALSLGIADVADVLVNLYGAAVGYLVADMIAVNIVIDSQQDAKAYVFVPKSSIPKLHINSVQIISCLLIVVVASAAVVYSHTAYSYQPWTSDVPVSEDKTLAELPASSEYIDADSALDGMMKFGVNDYGSASWLSVNDEGFIEGAGTLTQDTVWETSSGDICYGIMVGIVESVGDTAISHGVPLVVLPSTEVVEDGKSVNPFDKSYENSYFSNLPICPTAVTFSIQDGWLRAERISFAISEEAEGDDAVVDFDQYSASLEEAKDNSGKTISFERKIGTYSGYLDQVSYGEDDEDDSAYLRFNDRLGSALITHTVEMKCDTSPGYDVELDDSKQKVKAYARDGVVRLAKGDWESSAG